MLKSPEHANLTDMACKIDFKNPCTDLCSFFACVGGGEIILPSVTVPDGTLMPDLHSQPKPLRLKILGGGVGKYPPFQITEKHRIESSLSSVGGDAQFTQVELAGGVSSSLQGF